jgi:hypothetical protein
VEEEKKWYEKTEWIYILVILLWPVGLFLLWTNKEIPKKNKLIMSGIFGVLLITSMIVYGQIMVDIFKDLNRMLPRDLRLF